MAFPTLSISSSSIAVLALRFSLISEFIRQMYSQWVQCKEKELLLLYIIFRPYIEIKI
jgi:hypothetical protein